MHKHSTHRKKKKKNRLSGSEKFDPNFTTENTVDDPSEEATSMAHNIRERLLLKGKEEYET